MCYHYILGIFLSLPLMNVYGKGTGLGMMVVVSQCRIALTSPMFENCWESECERWEISLE